MTSTPDELVARARGRIDRVRPDQLTEVLAGGGLVVDIRPAAQRAEEGELDGAVVLERNVMDDEEWALISKTRFRPNMPLTWASMLINKVTGGRPAVPSCWHVCARSHAFLLIVYLARPVWPSCCGGHALISWSRLISLPAVSAPPPLRSSTWRARWTQ